MSLRLKNIYPVDVAHGIGDIALIHFKISMRLFYWSWTYYISKASKFCKH